MKDYEQLLADLEAAGEKDLAVRPATSEETKTVLRLYRAAKRGRFSVWNRKYPGMTEIQGDLEAESLFVLTKEGKIIGALSVVPENELDELDCWEVNAYVGEIARVCVDRRFRGRGYGELLASYGEKVLKEEGEDAVHLLVAVKNLPACRVYEKRGFRTVGSCVMYGNTYDCREKRLNEGSGT